MNTPQPRPNIWLSLHAFLLLHLYHRSKSHHYQLQHPSSPISQFPRHPRYQDTVNALLRSVGLEEDEDRAKTFIKFIEEYGSRSNWVGWDGMEGLSEAVAEVIARIRKEVDDLQLPPQPAVDNDQTLVLYNQPSSGTGDRVNLEEMVGPSMEQPSFPPTYLVESSPSFEFGFNPYEFDYPELDMELDDIDPTEPPEVAAQTGERDNPSVDRQPDADSQEIGAALRTLEGSIATARRSRTTVSSGMDRWGGMGWTLGGDQGGQRV